MALPPLPFPRPIALYRAGCYAALIAIVGGSAIWQMALNSSLGLVLAANVLFVPLERRFQDTEINDPASLVGMVVLGGGEERLREAGRLARAWPHLKVFVSGAGRPAYVWQQLGDGIAPGRVRIEEDSRTTMENARNSRQMIAPDSGERWLLVTSAVHMPRSIYTFRKFGFFAEPWPVRDLAADSPGAPHAAAHEWLGLAWYWLNFRLGAR